VYGTYFSIKKSWEDFKLRILKLLKENTELSGLMRAARPTQSASLTKDDIRLWSTSLSEAIRLQVSEGEANSLSGYHLDHFG
jgi:hypothetical protein